VAAKPGCVHARYNRVVLLVKQNRLNDAIAEFQTRVRQTDDTDAEQLHLTTTALY
jgi:hypothetical protein